MRVLLRADAGITQGTGHVMRCLTVGEELRRRGHDVHLMASDLPVPWLAKMVRSSGIPTHPAVRDELSPEAVRSFAPDWVVVDSYRIPANEVTAAGSVAPVLAIVDGDDRGIDAILYLDQNLGAKADPRVADRTMVGADYALVRRAVLNERRDDPWRFLNERPTVVSFMGGTDPTGASVRVTQALVAASGDAELVIVAPQELHDQVAHSLGNRKHTTISVPTPDLPILFGRADLVVTAAGTSTWDVCTLGIPSILVAVVENQVPSVVEAVAHGVALGLDAVDDQGALAEHLGPLITTLLSDEGARLALSRACQETFDGFGATRVADRMEQEIATT